MKQLTVLVPNRLGIAAEIATALAERSVNIDEIDIEQVEDHGLVVLSVDRYDEALRALHDCGFRVITQDALLIRLDDKPGALAGIAVRLKDAGLDVRSMHIVKRDGVNSLVSLVVNDNVKAAEILQDVVAVEPPRGEA